MKIINVNNKGVSLFLIYLFLIGLAGFASCAQPAPSSPAGQSQTTAPATAPDSPQAPPSTTWSPDGVIMTGEYAGSNTYGNYAIHWRMDDQFVYIGMSAKTSGWVAMALQPGSGMKDADMALGFVKDGKAEIQDSYCTDNFGMHPADTALGGKDDISSFGGREDGGVTTIEFKRLLTTGDKYDIVIKKGINKIMWSYGSGDNLALKHTDRGYGEINLQ